MIIDKKFFKNDVVCTACNQRPAVYQYPCYSEKTTFLHLCHDCSLHMVRDIVSDQCEYDTGSKTSDEHFNSDADTSRLVDAGVRFEQETQQ